MDDTKPPTLADWAAGSERSDPAPERYTLGEAIGKGGMGEVDCVALIALAISRSQDDEHQRARTAFAIQSWQLRQLLPTGKR